MIKLYQFAISHYCEKVRWALDYKGLPYKKINLLPGFHLKTILKNHKRSSVPVLTDGDTHIQNSAEIITFLDNEYPQKPLTPTDETLKSESQKWESYLDENLGVDVRLCCYHIMLEYPKLVIPFFTHGSPWYSKFLIPMVYSKIREKMRYFMKINNESFKISKQRLHEVIDSLNERMQNHSHLVGDSFTRADLTAASLLAPLRMPQGYGLKWPDEIPDELSSFFSEFDNKIQWVDRLYKDYRMQQ